MLEGRCQVVLISPELILCKRQWRELLCSEQYRANVVGVVVDEAHCVKKWSVCGTQVWVPGAAEQGEQLLPQIY